VRSGGTSVTFALLQTILTSLLAGNPWVSLEIVDPLAGVTRFGMLLPDLIGGAEVR
jgi:hypothetical protein